jgi:hypothetical protein
LITLPLTTLNRPPEWISPRPYLTVYKGKPEDVPAELWAKTEVLYTNTILPAAEQVPAALIQFHWRGSIAIRHPVGETRLVATTERAAKWGI